MSAERGFTLLELLVVLTVLALVSGLAASAYGGRDSRQQQRELAAVSQHLERVRAQAMASGSKVRAGIGDVAVAPVSAAHAASAAAVPAGLKSLRLDWRPIAATGSDRALAFYPDGSATPGELQFGAAGTSQRITIHWSGRVTLASDGI